MDYISWMLFDLFLSYGSLDMTCMMFYDLFCPVDGTSQLFLSLHLLTSIRLLSLMHSWFNARSDAFSTVLNILLINGLMKHI